MAGWTAANPLAAPPEVRRRVARQLIRSVALAAALLAPAVVRAQTTIIGAEHAGLALSGYVRALTGVHRASFDLPIGPRTTGFHGEVVRLRWRLSVGPRITLDLHNRLQAQISSAEAGLAAGGLGVSVVPGRSVDLTSHLVDEERLDVWHDVDRLALTVRTPVADVTVGRQAISWGQSSLFPVVDLWAQFSPFELDTEEKPGADAIRVLSYPWTGLELDAVVAARGRAEDWSAGLRATADLARADVYGAVAKLWNEVMAMGGVTWVLDRVKLRVEAAAPYDLDADDWLAPRATVGADWLGARFSVTAEYHHNGAGATDPGGYPAVLVAPPMRRGETYYLGRHYLGGAMAFTPDAEARASLAASALWNVGDGSAIVTPIASYDFGQATSISLGGILSFGRPPSVAPLTFQSEFGTYGDLWFTRLSVYF
jgi:hypothetical protein